MGATTTYDIQLKYSLNDSASQALTQLSGKAQKAEQSLRGIADGFKTIAGLFIGGAVFHQAKESFIDFNSDMQNLKTTMAGVASYNLSMPFEKAADQSERLVEGWQKFAVTSVLTTKQLASFGQQLAPAVFASGGDMKTLDMLTKKGAVLANAMLGGGEGAMNMGATQMSEALLGNLRKTERFNMTILQKAMQNEGLQLDSWNKLTTQKRMEIYLKALNDPAWNGMLKQQETSFSGEMSTLQDTIQIGLGKIGLPLFKAVTAEVTQWNKWLTDHPKEIEEFGRKFGGALVDGFNTIKTIAGFIIDHEDMFLAIAAAFGAIKVGTMAQGLGTLGGAFESLTTNAGNAAIALSVLYIALQAFADWADKKHKENVVREGDTGSFAQSIMGNSHGKGKDAVSAFLRLNQAGGIGMTGEIVPGLDRKIAGLMGGSMGEYANGGMIGIQDRNKLIAYTKAASDLVASIPLKDRLRMLHLGETNEGPLGGKRDDNGMIRPTGKGAQMNVTINKIEIASDDPDRFVFGLERALQKANKNPVQAESTLRGSF